MATQEETLIRIESPDSGVQYSVTEADYKNKEMAALDGQTYEAAGYTVVSYEDGTAYGGDEQPTDYAIASHLSAPPIGEVEGEEATPRATTESAESDSEREHAPAAVVAVKRSK